MEPSNKRTNITGFFIRRPVAAVVLSLLLFLLGLFSIRELPVRLYPRLDNNQITITTEYPGADSEVVQGYVTRIIGSAVSSVDGLDYVQTKSIQGQSTVTVVLELGADVTRAMTEVMAGVDRIKYLLPRDVYDPIITKTATGSFPLFYLGFYSESMSTEAITDFLNRVAQPKLAALPGVSQAQVMGSGTFSMRVDLEPMKMAALGVSATDVEAALLANDCIAAPGETKGRYVLSNIRLKTELNRPEQFSRLVVAARGDALIRLGDVARVRLGPENDDVYMTMNGIPAAYISVTNAPSANPLKVSTELMEAVKEIKSLLPPGVEAAMGYDATLFIRASVKEVASTLGQTVLIVIAVVILFLASLRAAIIPMVALPLSMVGVCAIMLAMGFSMNILTMLAMVLAIGLVVDDAILVTENTTRHIENGTPPHEAAVKAGNEVVLAILGMTVTLVAVFSPLAFMGGLTGSLFREFALTLAGAVVASAVVALTLSPVMASGILKQNKNKNVVASGVDAATRWMQRIYGVVLRDFLNHRAGAVIICLSLLCACVYLYVNTPKELAPKEDQSLFCVQGTGPSYANIDYLNLFSKDLDEIAKSIPELETYFVMNGDMGRDTVFGIYCLKPWGQRTRSQQEIMDAVSPAISNIAGLQTYTFGMPSLPGGYGLPVQVVLSTAKDNKLLYSYQEKMVDAAMESGLFTYISGSLKFNTPVTEVLLDRAKAAELGITMAGAGQVFGTYLSGAYVNRFIDNGRTYQVIPRLMRDYLDESKILDSEIMTASGNMVPLSNIAEIRRKVAPNALTQFDQLNSATLSGSLSPGVTLGQALSYMKGLAQKMLPPGFALNYTGQSRQYIQEGDRLLVAFAMSVVVIFLVLAAQMGSFREPLIIVLSVPGALCGALLPLYLGLGTINIFTQVGLLTLSGLIAKHSIMLVVMANEMRSTGLSRLEAAYQGAVIRLRPFMMTTAAMTAGVVPLVFADGAGAHSRFDIGLVLFCGMVFGSLATLIVVPVMYSLLAPKRSD